MVRKLFMALAWIGIVAGMGAAVRDEKHLVRPGEGIGVIKLGMTVPEVHAAMKEWGAEPLVRGASGGPGAWPDQKSGSLIEGYQTDPIGRGQFGNIMKVFYLKNRVAQISVQSVAYRTNKGAVTRMSSREWRSLHSSLSSLPVEESWGGKIRAYDSPTHGLAVTFQVLANNREAMSAQEVLVHLPGRNVLMESPRRPAGPAPGAGGGVPGGTQPTAPEPGPEKPSGTEGPVEPGAEKPAQEGDDAGR